MANWPPHRCAVRLCAALKFIVCSLIGVNARPMLGAGAFAGLRYRTSAGKRYRTWSFRTAVRWEVVPF